MGQMLAIRNIIEEGWNLDNWVYENSHEGTGWQALEMTYIFTRGLPWFVDAFEWIVLTIMMLLIAVSMTRFKTIERPLAEKTFGCLYITWTVLIAVFSLLDFVLEILHMTIHRPAFHRFSFLVSIVNRMLLLPSWLLILSCKLPGAMNAVEAKIPTEHNELS
jgi:hypothetical protein